MKTSSQVGRRKKQSLLSAQLKINNIDSEMDMLSDLNLI